MFMRFVMIILTLALILSTALNIKLKRQGNRQNEEIVNSGERIEAAYTIGLQNGVRLFAGRIDSSCLYKNEEEREEKSKKRVDINAENSVVFRFKERPGRPSRLPREAPPRHREGRRRGTAGSRR